MKKGYKDKTTSFNIFVVFLCLYNRKMNKWYILLMAISLIIVVVCGAKHATKLTTTIVERLTNNNQIVLLGDSVLNNASYVPKGQSVYDLLVSKSNNSNKVLNLAKDNATIVDLYSQLDKIPLELNNANTYVFISAGGNNLLQQQKSNENELQLFSNYMNFVKSLRTRLNGVKINILNLYLPANPRYESYAKVVDTWNELLKTNSFKIGEIYNVLDIHALLQSPEDFVYDIEPSAVGGEKIANLIWLT